MEINIDLMAKCEEKAEEAYHLEIIESEEIPAYTQYLYDKQISENNG